MTTVVATKKGIFADTRCTYAVPFQISKITQIGASVFGGAGDMDDLVRFFEWRRVSGRTKDAPAFEEGLDVLEVCAEGIFIWGTKRVRVLVNEAVYAVGSGAQYAMGAITAGATPEEAIEIAARFDEHTALPIEFASYKKKAR